MAGLRAKDRSLAGRDLLRPGVGRSRPGPTTRRGWSSAISFTGRPREAGEWIKAHPDRVSPQARIMTWFPWELRVTSDRTTILMPRNYNPRRIKEVIRQYGVTHILWGSFEPPPYYEINPESWMRELEQSANGTRLDRRDGKCIVRRVTSSFRSAFIGCSRPLRRTDTH